jgi:hypothetical protein
MKGLVRTLFVSTVLLLGAVTASPAAADDTATTPGAPVQLALGDSWAFGFGGNPDPTATDPYVDGYVPQLYRTLQEDYDCLPAHTEADGCKQLQLLNLAQGGAVTAPQPESPNRPSLTEDQFPDALPLLESRNGDGNPRNDVEVTTVHTGGNDVFGPIINACLGPSPGTCLPTVRGELRQYRIDLTEALSTLRGAAGDETIVIGTYDNSFRDQSPTTCSLAGNSLVIALGNLVLEGVPGFFQGMHDIMRSVGAQYQVQVAEVFGDLTEPADWFDCLHPTDSGYDKVTDAFEEVLGVGQSG